MNCSRKEPALFLAALRKTYSKNRWFLARYWFLIRRFRNFPQLIFSWRCHSPCGVATQWNGSRLYHPSGRTGLVEALLELWFEDQYCLRRLTIPAGGVVVDIGANVGLFSIQVALRVPK